MAKKFKSFETRDKPRKRGPRQHKKSLNKKENMQHFFDLSESAKEFEKIINKGEDEDDITYN